MKGMIYKDGKFISILTDMETESLYAELPRNKKKSEDKNSKKANASKTKKRKV